MDATDQAYLDRNQGTSLDSTLRDPARAGITPTEESPTNETHPTIVSITCERCAGPSHISSTVEIAQSYGNMPHKSGKVLLKVVRDPLNGDFRNQAFKLGMQESGENEETLLVICGGARPEPSKLYAVSAA